MSTTRIIDDKDLIQVNAAIIAGVLVLLSLSIYSKPNLIDAFKSILTLATIAPFAISSAIILLGNFQKKTVKNYLNISSALSVSGFLYIVVTVGFIVVFSVQTK